jgi:AAA15 family ATPase/GTPase/5S rRNA maturation endonuclease (ribonuclease M5)
MKIISFEIKNYKNLEDAVLTDCTDFHTIIGKNSGGKTSIFDALTILSHQGSPMPNILEIVNGGIQPYEEKMIEVKLTINLYDVEREQYMLNYFSIDPNSVNQLLSSNFLRWLELTVWIRVVGEKLPNKDFQSHVSIVSFKISDAENGSMSIIDTLNSTQLRTYNFAGQLQPKLSGSPSAIVERIKHRSGEVAQTIPRTHGPLPNNVFPGRVIFDFVQSLKIISSTRESQKRLKITTINELGNDRGSQLVNLMDTMFTNENKRYREVEDYCKRIFSDIEEIHPQKMLQEMVRIMIRKKNLPTEIDLENEGKGIEQLLIIIWRIATSSKNTIWLLDEPELHLHPGAQKLLYDFLREEVKRGKQILVASHSMVFIHKSEPSEVSLIINNDGKGHLVKLSNLISAEKSDRVSLSDARNHIYQALGYDPIFSYEPKTVVVVEGSTDEKVLKNFGKILDMPIQNNATMFIPAGNKGDAERFAPLLAYALAGKRTIIIVDNDDQTPEEIKNSLFRKEENYRRSIGINNKLLTDHSFYPYRKEAYSIKYYLLDANAICKTAGISEKAKIDEIEKKITKEKQKPLEGQGKPKEFLRGIWEDNGFGQYAESETPELISQNVTKEYLKNFYELTDILKAITDTA